MSAAKEKAKPQRRNAAETQQRLLKAAKREFCQRGYDGARMEQIVKRAGCNIRMAYHYFGGKEGLYLAVLEEVYGHLREQERELALDHLAPLEAMQSLLEFTFSYMAEHPDFISLVRNENLLAGRILKKSHKVVQEATPLVGMIENIIERGEATGVFRRNLDPYQLYISILSLSVTHIANRYTLSVLFQQDLGDPQWLAVRRGHAVDMILAYLKPEK